MRLEATAALRFDMDLFDIAAAVTQDLWLANCIKLRGAAPTSASSDARPALIEDFAARE
jgi:hypothetical protein